MGEIDPHDAEKETPCYDGINIPIYPRTRGKNFVRRHDAYAAADLPANARKELLGFDGERERVRFTRERAERTFCRRL